MVRLGQLGSEGLAYRESGKKPEAAWVQNGNALLKQAAEHHEIVDFVVLRQLQVLVDAVSGTPAAAATTP